MRSITVSAAQRDQVVEVCCSEVIPFDEMVDVTAIKVVIAALDRTCAVERAQCGALGRGRQTARPTHIQRSAVAAEDDGNDACVTGMTPRGLCGNRRAV